MVELASTATVNRQQRRRGRTRAALVSAAQSFLAEGNGDVSIQALTERADLGFGTFYNHFVGKDELMAAAQDDAFERYSAWLSNAAGPQEDAIASLTVRIRLTGRLGLVDPRLARVIAGLAGERGGTHSLHPLGLEAIRGAVAAMRSPGEGEEIESATTVAMIAGAVAAVLRAASDLDPARQARMADACAKTVLLMLDTSAERIRELLGRPVLSERLSPVTLDEDI